MRTRVARLSVWIPLALSFAFQQAPASALDSITALGAGEAWRSMAVCMAVCSLRLLWPSIHQNPINPSSLFGVCSFPIHPTSSVQRQSQWQRGLPHSVRLDCRTSFFQRFSDTWNRKLAFSREATLAESLGVPLADRCILFKLSCHILHERNLEMCT